MKRFFILLAALTITVLVLTPAAVAFAQLDNPLGNVTDPRTIIGNVIRAALGLVGSLALAMFVFGGFTWVTSAGNDEKVKRGKDMIMWAVFGLAVIFASYAIVTFVIGAISSGTTGGGGAIPSGGGPTIPAGGGG